MVRKILEKAILEKKVLSIVSDCYSEHAVVLHVGDDSVTVCDTPQLLKIYLRLQRMASEQSAKSSWEFARGNLRRGLRYGHLAKHLHACVARLNDDLSIRTIDFKDLVGFTF